MINPKLERIIYKLHTGEELDTKEELILKKILDKIDGKIGWEKTKIK